MGEQLLSGRRSLPPIHEPCVSCGEETSVGSVFFSGRLKISRPDSEVFVCAPCYERIRSAQKRARWTDEDVSAFTRNASAAAITWWSRY